MRTHGKALLCFFVVASICAPSLAVAQTCNWNASNINFNTIDAVNGVDTTGFAQINCNGTNGRTLRLCLNFGYGTGGQSVTNRRMLNGSNVLNYQLYSDTWGGTVWGSTLFPPNPPNPSAITVTLPSNVINVTIYARAPGGQATAPAGHYTTSYSAANDRILYYQYCTQANPPVCPACATFPLSSSGSNFTVDGVVQASCAVTATALNFGSTIQLNANVDSTNTINVTCTPSTSWTVSLSAGNGAGATLTNRKMTGPGGGTISYTIYRDTAHTQVWGNGSGGTFNVTGTGNGLAQGQIGYGRVPVQAMPNPGNYSDTVVVTVTY